MIDEKIISTQKKSNLGFTKYSCSARISFCTDFYFDGTATKKGELTKNKSSQSEIRTLQKYFAHAKCTSYYFVVFYFSVITLLLIYIILYLYKIDEIRKWSINYLMTKSGKRRTSTGTWATFLQSHTCLLCYVCVLILQKQ